MDAGLKEELENEIKRADALIEQYLPDESILQTISDGLLADKPISCNIIAKSGGGQKDADSMTKDFIDVPDWSNRLKAADMALKLKGKYPSEKHKVEISGSVDIAGRLANALSMSFAMKAGGNGQ